MWSQRLEKQLRATKPFCLMRQSHRMLSVRSDDDSNCLSSEDAFIGSHRHLEDWHCGILRFPLTNDNTLLKMWHVVSSWKLTKQTEKTHLLLYQLTTRNNALFNTSLPLDHWPRLGKYHTFMWHSIWHCDMILSLVTLLFYFATQPTFEYFAAKSCFIDTLHNSTQLHNHREIDNTGISTHRESWLWRNDTAVERGRGGDWKTADYLSDGIEEAVTRRRIKPGKELCNSKGIIERNFGSCSLWNIRSQKKIVEPSTICRSSIIPILHINAFLFPSRLVSTPARPNPSYKATLVSKNVSSITDRATPLWVQVKRRSAYKARLSQ
jgi:hypothetical protein